MRVRASVRASEQCDPSLSVGGVGEGGEGSGMATRRMSWWATIKVALIPSTIKIKIKIQAGDRQYASIA